MKYTTIIKVIVSIWFFLVLSSFLWNISVSVKKEKDIALQTARNLFQNIVITRHWNARNNGVYVPVNEYNKPNKYLKDKMRDIFINDDFRLTKINPAYMTRQISEIAEKKATVNFHITSIKPIRPENKPTERERKYLLAFEKGVKERSEFIKKNNAKYFFYMAPLITKKSCLKCHKQQGYKVGDIRGGISITFPFMKDIQIMPLLFGHFLIFIFGLLGLIILGVELNKAYEEIKEQAVMDALTGVANRRSFMETLLREFNRCLRSHKPLSVIMCDVDNFKVFNDNYGHKAGDNCLKKVAQTVKSSLNRATDFCARYGGEEFIVILPDTTLKGAQLVAERIRKNIENLKIPHEKSLPYKVVTISLGITCSHGFDINKNEQDILIKQADAALYKAKEFGKNRVEVFCDKIIKG